MSRKFPFTKRSIEVLPCNDPDSPSREAEYSDSEMIGLKLRVSKNGRRFFQHRYRYLGRKKCMALGEFPHVSVQDARKRVSENKSLLARDIDPSEERQQKRNDLTLNDYIDQFYIPHAMSHKKTWQTDIYMLNKIKPLLGKLRLSTITTRDITNFHSKQKELNTAVTANHYLILIRRLFNLAIQWGLGSSGDSIQNYLTLICNPSVCSFNLRWRFRRQSIEQPILYLQLSNEHGH